MVLGTTDWILPEDLPEALLDTVDNVAARTTFHEAVAQSKKQIIQNAMDQAKGNLNDAARLLGVTVHSAPVRTAADFDAAFAAIAKERPGGFIVLADRVFLHNRKRIVDFAAQNRIPAVYAYRELVDAGGLMSFGPNYPDMHRRAATYVDRILKGAKPADLPIELPTKFELYLNLKTAGTLGLAIPQLVLLRASDVIQ